MSYFAGKMCKVYLKHINFRIINNNKYKRTQLKVSTQCEEA
jgi:hypothetical protein